MALVDIGGAIFLPAFYRTSGATFQINANGEVASLVFIVPKTGNLTRFEAFTSAVGVAPVNGQRFSFQDVSLTTGLPDLVVDQFATVAAGSVAVGWTNPGDFNSPRAVTKGQLLAAVVDIGGAFTAGDNFTMGGNGVGNNSDFPYSTTAANSKTSNRLAVAIRYDDGTYGYVAADLWPTTAIAAVSIDVNTTPDEFGLAFTLPYPATIGGAFISLGVVAGGDFDMVLYDSASTPLATKSHDGNVTSSSLNSDFVLGFDTPVDVDAGSLYRLVVKPTTTNNIDVLDATIASLALFDATEGGRDFYSTQRTNAGAWTDFNSGTFRKPRLAIMITAVDDGSGGGGGGAHSSAYV